MNLWIQNHDFSSSERDGVGIEDAIDAFDSHDWQSEIQKEKDAIAEGDECCPAGLGLVSDHGNILHLIPGSDGLLMVHYHWKKKKKLLGFLSVDSEEITTVWNFPNKEVKEAVRLHYDGESELLIDFLKAFGTLK